MTYFSQLQPNKLFSFIYQCDCGFYNIHGQPVPSIGLTICKCRGCETLNEVVVYDA